MRVYIAYRSLKEMFGGGQAQAAAEPAAGNPRAAGGFSFGQQKTAFGLNPPEMLLELELPGNDRRLVLPLLRDVQIGDSIGEAHFEIEADVQIGLATSLLMALPSGTILTSVYVRYFVRNAIGTDRPCIAFSLPGNAAWAASRVREFRNVELVSLSTPSNPSGISTLSNRISLVFRTSVSLHHILLTLRDWEYNKDFVNQTVWEGNARLPLIPGVTTIESHGAIKAVQWNAAAVISWTPQNHWLYPRSLRLAFYTLILIRRFSNSALSMLDINIVKKIFGLIASPENSGVMPILIASEQTDIVVKQREMYVKLLEDSELEFQETIMRPGGSALQNLKFKFGQQPPAMMPQMPQSQPGAGPTAGPSVPQVGMQPGGFTFGPRK